MTGSARQLRPGTVERLECFAQQILQPAVSHAADQLVGFIQEPGNVLAIRVCAWSMVDPSRSVERDGSPGGTRSTYCSPTAETLLTVAVTFSGTGVPLLIRMFATTPSLVSPTDSTRPTVTPR